MDYGGHMKGSDKPKFDKKVWDMIIGKLKKLGTAIEMHFGDRMNIDHPEYRWVTDRIEYYESQDRLLTPDEMSTANDMWKRYQ